MGAGDALQLAFILLLTLLRIMEICFERSRTPFDPNDRIKDHRRHFDRQPRDDKTVGKDTTYDAIAREQIERLHKNRRRPNIDNHLRRRRTD